MAWKYVIEKREIYKYKMKPGEDWSRVCECYSGAGESKDLAAKVADPSGPIPPGRYRMSQYFTRRGMYGKLMILQPVEPEKLPKSRQNVEFLIRGDPASAPGTAGLNALCLPASARDAMSWVVSDLLIVE